MTRKEYNGWTNYESWVVNLWMTNDEGSSSYWDEQADDIIKRDRDASCLACRLQNEHEENLPEVHGFAADLLTAAMSEVNWEEIAEHLLEDAKERVES